MEVMSVSEAARFGMTYERARVETASQNLALANVAYASAAEAQNAAEKITSSMFELLSGVGAAKETPAGESLVKTVYDPSNPHADARGNVFYVDVDPVKEMATLVSAVRAYEANIRAYNTNSEMNRAALSIGER